MWSRRIAIIGIALRFPGADTAARFWADSQAGRSRIHRFTERELAAAGMAAGERTAADVVGASGVLPGIDRFDADFFGMTAREAAVTDPQQRLLLECCYHALEDGGYPVQPPNARIGVYACTGYRLYSLHSYLASNLAVEGWSPDWMTDKQVQVGNYPDFAATRVAFRLGLTGPAINVATACSGSLVAVHLACQALLLGDAELALVGSAALHLPQVTGHRYVKGSTISRSGVIRPFDARADGTVGGNGVAAVLLKPLDRALADGDPVHAVLAGSGIGNDGATKAGFAAPSVAGQRDAVLRAIEAADVPVESIGYLEAHGTGTAKGDPIEFDALSSAFLRHTDRTGFCALGTVKSRIGHLDSCAGLAGLINAVLAVRHGVIPPLVGFGQPNPALDLLAGPFTLSARARPWPVPGPRRAGVHSVGMGGTNAHVIVEQAADPAPGATGRPPVPGVLPLSAADPHALRDYAAAVRDQLRSHPDTELADLVTTTALGRRHFPHRLAVTGATTGELADALDAQLRGGPPTGGDAEASALAQAYRAGADIDWAATLRGRTGRRIPLPHYPFRRTRHWVGPPLPLDAPDAQHIWDDTEAVMPEPTTPQRAPEQVLERVLELTARHLGYRPGEPDPERTLVDLGADSLQLIGMLLELEGEFGVEISMAELLEAAGTPQLIADLLHDRRPPDPGSRPADAAPAAGARTSPQRAHVDDLTRRLTERTRTSKEITQRHREVLADSRAAVGFRSATKEMRYPIAARSARGARLEDVDGNSYVDITMGFGALLLGHEPECVTDAVRAHLSHGLRFGPRSVDTGETAALLAELTGMQRVAFACSGTEANSAAIRLARAATGRDRIVMFRGSYHGHIDAVLGRPGGRGDLRTVPVSPGIPDSAVAEVLVLDYGDPRSLEIIAEHADTIAAVLVEPVQCRNPELRPAGFVRSLRELTSSRGIVLIFDEMLTGLRPHPGGAQQHYGVRADLATYGKALGSGFPIGAVAGRADILDGVDGGFWRYGDDSGPSRDTVFFGGTYLQHPVSMAAARAVLTRLRQAGPDLQASINARTDRLAATLNGFFTDEDFPLRMVHFGSMFRFAHRADMELLYHHLLLRGVHVWEWRSFYLSAAHTDADVEYVADAVRESLRELRRAGYFPTTRPRAVGVPARRERHERPAPDFSISFFGDYPQDEPGSTGYRGILDTARFADQHGFHALWLPERHFHSFGGLFPNPAVLAAALAGVTSRIRLHAGSVVLPLHDPIRVAEEWSVVDNLSGGRVGLGFGTGWHAEDFTLHPDRFERRRDIAFEHLADLRRLWRGESLRRRSGSGTEVDVRVHPRPLQSRPPMWLATTGRAESYEQAARLDLGVLTNLMNQTPEQLADNIERYRRTRSECGLDPDAGRVTVLLHTYLADDHSTARADAREPMIRYLRSSLLMRSAAVAGGATAADLAAASPEHLDTLFRRAYDRYCDHRALIGTPESCAPLVASLRAAGVDEIAALVDFGMSAEQVRTGLVRLDQLRRRCHPEPQGHPEPQAPVGERSGPATAAQRRVWLACQLIGPSAYNEIQAVRLRGQIDGDALCAAVRGLVDRHPGLRTVFRLGDQDHQLLQVVRDRIEIAVAVTDHSTEDAEGAIAAVVREESRRVYDLARGPLCTARLLRLGADDHALVLGIHHLVTDGHSAGIVAADLTRLYRATPTGDPPRLAVPAGSPLDLDLPEPDPADLGWWRAHLGPQPPVLRPPTDRERTGAVPGTGGSVGGWFDDERTCALRRWCGQQGVTLFAALLTAWRVVLRRFSGQDEFVVGATFGQRPAQARDTVGFFVSLLPLRAALHDDTSLREAVRAARDTVLAAGKHTRVDLDALLAQVNPAPGSARPLIAVSVDLDTDALAAITLPDVRAEPVAEGAGSAPLELSLMAVPIGSGLRLRIRYDAGLYDESTVRRYLGQLDLVLGAVADGRDGLIGHLPMLTAEDMKQLRALNDREPGGPPEPTPLDIPSPARLPDVVDDTGRHGAAELRGAADAIAAQLAGLGVRRGDVVAIALPPGHAFVAAVLGVVAVGAGYLPLDLRQPVPRLATMVSDACPVALVCADGYDPAFGPGLRLVRSGGRGPVPAREPLRAPEPIALTGRDLLCLLYTSGSTGTPKGVALEHGNLAATLAVFGQRLEITSEDRLSWYSSPGFDAFHLELWPALQTGADLYVVPDDVRLEPAALVSWLVERRITVAFLPTAVGEAVLAQPWPTHTALRVLCVGGERLNSRPGRDIPFTLFNIYGPTECSVFCSWGPVAADEPGSPSLGRPNPGMRMAVRDRAGRPLPPGAVGELHVGGPQVARGYHADPRLSADRFSVDGDGRRWYRTGDLVRWRNDGTLAFVGRRDEQVQIRGVRVEPAEVTRAVRALPGIRDARVVGSTDERTGHSQLTCHVLLADDRTGPATEVDDVERARRWRAGLAEVLPAPMVPLHWQVVTELPLNTNGKWAHQHTVVADATAAVRQEWAEVLGVDRFTDDARFFDLGGHSISAMTLINRVRERFRTEYPLAGFFADPTVRGMVAQLTGQVLS